MHSYTAQPWFPLSLPWLARRFGNAQSLPESTVPDNSIVGALTFPMERSAVAAIDGRPDLALGEEAFRWLLTNERARAGRSGRPLRLLLVSLQRGPREAVQIEPAAAARLFAALRGAARETDVIGWYRENRVAGVVLTEDGNENEHDDGSRILQRFGGALQERLPSRVGGQLRLRAFRVRPAASKNGRREESLPDTLNE